MYLAVRHFLKLSFYSLLCLGLVLSGFVLSQKLKTPLKNSAEAATCSPQFSDSFTNKNNIKAGSDQNVTINGENYTTNGSPTNLTMIAPGNPGVRLRNFYDPMKPSLRPGGSNYSDVWDIYLNSLSTASSDNSAADYGLVLTGRTNSNEVMFSAKTKAGKVQGLNNTFKFTSRWRKDYHYAQDLGGVTYRNSTGGTGPQINGTSVVYPQNQHIDIEHSTNAKLRLTDDVALRVIQQKSIVDGNNSSLVLENQWYSGSLEYVDSDGDSIGAVYGTEGRYTTSTKTTAWGPRTLLTDTNGATVYTRWDSVSSIGFGIMPINGYTTFMKLRIADVRVDWAIKGTVESTDITKPVGGSYRVFNASSVLNEGSIQYELINSANGAIIPVNGRNYILPGDDLASIPASITSVRLRANITRPDIYKITPVLLSWSLSCNIPTPTPPPTACTGISWSNGTNNVNLLPGQQSTITITGTPNNLGGSNSVFQVYDMRDINDGAPYTILATYTSPTSSGVSSSSSSLTLNYATLQALNGTSYKIHGYLPNGMTDYSCAVYVTLVSPPSLVSGGYQMTCDASPNQNNIYRIKTSITVAASNIGTSVSKVRALIAPLNSNYTFTYDKTTDIVSGVSLNSTVNVGSASPNVSALPRYTTTDGSFVKNGTNATLQFVIVMNPADAFYKSFYDTSTGFILYLAIVDDQNIDNLNSGNVIPNVASSLFRPYDCGNIYFQTSAGDMRSNESGGGSGPAANKVWQQDTVNTYKAISNPSSTQLSMKTSDFSYEYNPASSNCASRHGVGDFCTGITSTGITQSQLITSLDSSITNAVNTYKTLSTIQINNSTPNSTYFQIGDGSLVTLTLANLPSNTPTLITIEDYVNVKIIDSTAAQNKNLIVWCKTESCIMRIQSLGTIPSGISINTSSNSISYSTSLYSANTRVYLNYLSSETVLSSQPGQRGYPTGGARQVILTETDPNAVNYYSGAIITSGFVYTDASSKTNIVKGTIVSRGLVISGERASGNSKLFFKDFFNTAANHPVPFLYIDYDPKFFLTIPGLLTRSTRDVGREYVGL